MRKIRRMPAQVALRKVVALQRLITAIAVMGMKTRPD
jgi:hypothetical protein